MAVHQVIEDEEINPRTGKPFKSSWAVRQRAAKWYRDNLERAKASNRKSYAENRAARLAKAQEWAEKNRGRSNALKQAWKKSHRDTYLKQQRQYARGRTEEMRENLKRWRRENNSRFRRTTNLWRRNRLETDPKYKAECKWRAATLSFVFNSSDRKSKLTPIFGCTPSFWRAHLEKGFVEGMCWENHGKRWHIDHIQQLWTFDLTQEDQVKTAIHYSNTRPTWARENMQQQPPPKLP